MFAYTNQDDLRKFRCLYLRLINSNSFRLHLIPFSSNCRDGGGLGRVRAGADLPEALRGRGRPRH